MESNQENHKAIKRTQISASAFRTNKLFSQIPSPMEPSWPLFGTAFGYLKATGPSSSPSTLPFSTLYYCVCVP